MSGSIHIKVGLTSRWIEMPEDLIRSMALQHSLEDADVLVTKMYLGSEEYEKHHKNNPNTLKEFLETILNAYFWEEIFKRDFPTAHTRAKKFLPKEVEKQRDYWSRQYTEMYQAAYYSLTENQKKLFGYAARGDLTAIAEGFKNNEFSLKDFETKDNEVFKPILFKPVYSATRLASIKKHQLILDFLYQKNHEIYQKRQIKKDNSGSTLLHGAALLNQYQSCEELINSESINETENSGRTALHFASLYGHLEIVQLLVDNDATLDIQSNGGNTPFHLACQYGHLEIAKLLAEKKKELLDVTNKKGCTALHLACMDGHLDVVKFLIEKNPGLLDKKDGNDNTVLHFACQGGQIDIAELLIQKKPELLDVVNKDNQTVFHSACMRGQIEMVKWLTRQKRELLDISISDILTFFSGNHVDVVQFLLEQKPELRDKASKKSFIDTPLHTASLVGATQVVKLLLSKGADLNAKNVVSQTPLHYARFHKRTEVIRLLNNEKTKRKKVAAFIEQASTKTYDSEISFVIALLLLYREPNRYKWLHHKDKVRDLLRYVEEQGDTVTLEDVRGEITKIITGPKNKKINPIGDFNSLCEFILSEEKLSEAFLQVKNNEPQEGVKKQEAVDLLTSYTRAGLFFSPPHLREANDLIKTLKEAPDSEVSKIIKQAIQDNDSSDDFSETLHQINVKLILGK